VIDPVQHLVFRGHIQAGRHENLAASLPNLRSALAQRVAADEIPLHQGRLRTAHTPPNWHEVMLPHFQPWDDEQEKGGWKRATGRPLWRLIELVCSA